MKLISCHVENFGKLQDYSVDFANGVNVICRENGWGKSTFAAFIRAMFYGLEGERKRGLLDNERKRYKPWQGGIFGGQLVFETGGRSYQITRIFQDKEANDTFELRDAKTNLPSKDYSKRIGEELFKINRESFLRTVFITQSECETKATDDINAKIGNLSDHTHDLNRFDAASERLTEILNALTPRRATGSLHKRKEEIAGYERRVQSGQDIAASLDTYQQYLQSEQSAYEALKVQLHAATKQQDEASKQRAAAAEKAEWSRLKKAAMARAEEAAQTREQLPGRLFSAEELKDKINLCSEMEKGRERISLYQLTKAEDEELSSLSAVFAGGVPENIDDKIREAAELGNLEQELAAKQLTEEEEKRLSVLAANFAQETESVTEIASAWHMRNNKKAALEAFEAATAQKRQTKKLSPLVAAGIVIVLLGVAAAFIVKAVIGVIFAALGGVLLLAGLLLSKKSEKALPESWRQEQMLISQTDARVAAYFSRHGRTFEENTADAVLQELTMESLEYASLKKKAAQAEGPERETAAKRRRNLTAWLSAYGAAAPAASLSDALYELKERTNRFLVLREKRESLQKEEAAYAANRLELTEFLQQNGYQPEENLTQQLGKIQSLTEKYRMEAKLQAEAGAELQSFEINHDMELLSALPEIMELPSLEELQQQIVQLTDQMQEAQKTINAYRKTLADLQEKQEEWEENSAYLQELKQRQLAEQRKYDAISVAKEKLTQAKEAITARYAEPIRKGFSAYYEKISGEAAEAFRVDANTNVTVDALGKQRDIAALSSGYRDLVGICLRVALVDAMYQEEAPVLIMDDPFTNLDDEKSAAAIEFLKEIAKKYQIIYFTCSRKRVNVG